MIVAPLNVVLLVAAAANALAALLHVGCIVYGAPWYRFFGAGERMAQLALAGDPYPTRISLAVVTVLLLWAAYALSGAGAIPRLPLLRLGLCLIAGIFLLRGVAGIVLALTTPARNTPFWWWSSAICLAIGALHLIGTLQVWPRL
jgi:hypothetical protein